VSRSAVLHFWAADLVARTNAERAPKMSGQFWFSRSRSRSRSRSCSPSSLASSNRLWPATCACKAPLTLARSCTHKDRLVANFSARKCLSAETFAPADTDPERWGPGERTAANRWLRLAAVCTCWQPSGRPARRTIASSLRSIRRRPTTSPLGGCGPAPSSPAPKRPIDGLLLGPAP